jgi:hypothetical protein
METCFRRAVQPQIMPENTVNIILTIPKKHDAANYVTGIYRYLGSKQIASNTIVQVTPK